MARVTTVLGDRRWRHDLSQRDLDYNYFLIPQAIIEGAGIAASSKRRGLIRLSTGRYLWGFCTISSGTELLFPTALQPLVREADWFECEIVGDQTSDEVTLQSV